MASPHPVHALLTDLEAARLQAVEALAAARPDFASDAVRDLATLQSVIIAVREAVEAHGAKLGWGGEPPLD